MENLKEGVYLIKDEPFATAYFVHKVMNKTVKVAIRTSNWKNGDLPFGDDEIVSSSMHYRYDKELLGKQVKDAEYRSFTT